MLKTVYLINPTIKIVIYYVIYPGSRSNVPVLSIATYITTIVIDICLYSPFIIVTDRIQADTHVDNIVKHAINLLSK